MTRTAYVSVVPQRSDLALYAGDGLALQLTVTDANTNEPLDLTGEITAQIKPDHDTATAAADFAVDTTDAATGVLELALTGEQTGALATFKGFWDVQWTAPGEEPRTLIQGRATCTPDVTRP